MNMNKKLINQIVQILIGGFLFLGIFFHNGDLYIYGKGVEYEHELTLGLSDLLKLGNVTFYEVNFLMSSILISGILFLLLKISSLYKKEDMKFDVVYVFTLLFFMIPMAIFAYSFQEIKDDDTSKTQYTERYFKQIDDLIETNHQIVIDLEEAEYQTCFFSFLLFIISWVTLMIRFIFPKKDTRIDTIDHLFEN